MKRFGLFSLVWFMAVLSGFAQLQGDWPLTNSLINQSEEGWLELVPYGSSGRLFLTNECFSSGSLKMEGMALTTAPYLSVAKGVTVAGWFNLEELEMGFSATAPHTLAFLHNSANSESQFVFRILDGTLSAYSKSANKNVKTDFMVQEEEWTFFALVLTDKSVTVYQNGYTPQVVPFECADEYDRFYIGAVNAKGLRAFKGQMKNLKLYSEALSSRVLKKLYEKERLLVEP